MTSPSAFSRSSY